MTFKELKKMIRDVEKKKAPSVFLCIPRTQAKGTLPGFIQTDFGPCPIINADEEKVYFEVTLLQMKALFHGMRFERQSKT